MPINDPEEIPQYFDEIAYNKGASIIRMMANFLGLDIFNKGIHHYLTKHQYGNTKQVNQVADK